MKYRVRELYISREEVSAAGDAGVQLPEGWEPIGGEVEEGGALRLVIAKWGDNPYRRKSDFGD